MTIPVGRSHQRTSGGTAVNVSSSLDQYVSKCNEETHPLPRGGTDLIGTRDVSSQKPQLRITDESK